MVDNLIAASSTQFLIQKNLQDLVQHYMPAKTEDAAVQRFVQYSMRLLGARIQPANVGVTNSGGQSLAD